jgi:hypothetical protein
MKKKSNKLEHDWGSFGPGKNAPRTEKEMSEFWKKSKKEINQQLKDSDIMPEEPKNTIAVEDLTTIAWVTFIEQNQHILKLRPDQLMELGFVDGKMKEIDLDKTNKISDNILNELMPKKKRKK